MREADPGIQEIARSQLEDLASLEFSSDWASDFLSDMQIRDAFSEKQCLAISRMWHKYFERGPRA